VDKHKIIDVAPVITNLQLLLYECIELVQIEIRENLAREITDGESDAGRSEKQALRPRESYPILPPAFYDTVFSRIVFDDSLT